MEILPGMIVNGDCEVDRACVCLLVRNKLWGNSQQFFEKNASIVSCINQMSIKNLDHSTLILSGPSSRNLVILEGLRMIVQFMDPFGVY